jgi:hypothetical protein
MMTISQDSLKSVLDAVRSNKEARKVFLAMSREDQLLAILEMISYNNNQLANVLNRQEEQRKDQQTFRDELTNSRKSREALELQLADKLHIAIQQPEDKTLTTTEKVKAVLTTQYGGVIKFFMDIFKNLLQTVLTIITLAILYFVFGGKVPTP